MKTTDDLIQKEIEEFNKKWSRIEKTMTGHISGRKIWDADTQGHDDEANYLYVDETLERHFKKSLHKIKDEAKREAIEEIREELINLGKHFNYEKIDGQWMIKKELDFNTEISYGRQQVLEHFDEMLNSLKEEGEK